jgi:hypothetical protein
VSSNGPARWQRARRVLPVALVACLLLAAGVAPARSHRRATSPGLAADAAAVQAELSGIPQQGLTLGSSTAPVTVIEYVDLICMRCARAATDLLAPLIGDYVRQGTVQLELAPISQSERSSQYAYGTYSAALQGEAWNYALLAWARSTRSTDGPADAPATLARALGLNLARWRSNLFRPRWANAIEQTVAVVSVGGFTSFPVFTVRGLPDARGHVVVKILRSPVSLPALTAAITGAQTPPAPTH